jgi:hypothetical protein
MILVHALFKIRMYYTTVGCLSVEKLENKGMRQSFHHMLNPRFYGLLLFILLY